MKQKILKPTDWFSLILWYVPIFFVQLISTRVTQENIQGWYTGLVKPTFNPPNWVFGPIWTLIYILIALSIWNVFIAKPTHRKRGPIYVLFWVQLALNVAWSFLFFQYHLIGAALLDLIALIIIIYLLMRKSFKIRTISGVFLIPYFLWVLYALALNATFWFLN